LSRRSQKSEPRRDAEANLVSRFASGEITTEEYRARRAVLREKP
ncbi:MAG: SHOCT domain-containing protein, partial [Microbacterium sp.]